MTRTHVKPEINHDAQSSADHKGRFLAPQAALHNKFRHCFSILTIRSFESINRARHTYRHSAAAAKFSDKQDISYIGTVELILMLSPVSKRS